MSSLTNPKVLRPKEVAVYLSISLTTFWRLVQRGELPRGIKISSRCSVWRVDELDKFLERKQQA